MIIAMALSSIPIFVLAFTKSTTSVIVYLAMLGITGIAESFRGVSVTTMAQTCLEPKDLGIGTALVNFVNTIAGLTSATVFGIAYDLQTKMNPTDPANILRGSNSVHLIGAIVSLIGLFIVIFMTKGMFKEDNINN